MEYTENETTTIDFQVQTYTINSDTENLKIPVEFTDHMAVDNDSNIHDNLIPMMNNNNKTMKQKANGMPIIKNICALENDIDDTLITVGLPGTALQYPKQKPIHSSNDGTKLYSCYFCNKCIKGKITDHWFSVHKDEPKIKEILALPPALRTKGHQLTDSQKLREKLIGKLRKEGNFKRIMNASLSDTCTTVRRNRKNKQPKNLSDYRLCSSCHGLYKI